MLTYLFRAYFEDGAYYEQTPEDTARVAASGSSFTDILNMQHVGKRLVAFSLASAETGDLVAAVHLDTGHFEISGNEFYAGVEGLDDPAIERRLIYFRQVTQQREMDIDTVTGEELSGWRETTHTRYVIGWQATASGANVQHMIALDG